tara:strand:- start:2874 stop:3125 length:252 start_codon:yes stop_codon:yes gene_type:complete
MSTQVDQEPILELDGEKHIISELSDEAKVIIGRLQINEDELVKAQIVVERLMLSKEAYTNRLKEAVNAPDPDPESEPEEVITS